MTYTCVDNTLLTFQLQHNDHPTQQSSKHDIIHDLRHTFTPGVLTAMNATSSARCPIVPKGLHYVIDNCLRMRSSWAQHTYRDSVCVRLAQIQLCHPSVNRGGALSSLPV